MNKLILIVFLAALSYLFYHYYQKSKTSENEMEQMVALLAPLKEVLSTNDQLYLNANNKSAALFFKIQFAIAPLRILDLPASGMPKGAFLLSVTDKGQASAMKPVDTLCLGCPLLWGNANATFSVHLNQSNQ